MKTLVTVAIVGVALWSIPPAVLADDVGNAFTYQGELRQGGSPATGTFVIEFSLWDDSMTPPGVQISLTESKKVTPDPDGRFTVTLDFGVAPYMTNEALWLQIVVNGSPLSPRQRLTPAPFSLATRGLNVTSTGRLQIGNNSIIGISNAGTSLGNLELSQTVSLNNFNAGNIRSDVTSTLPCENTTAAWWIVALLRLRTGPRLRAPVLSNYPLTKDAASSKNLHIQPLEVTPHQLMLDPEAKSRISVGDLEWTKANWVPSFSLLQNSSKFSILLQSFDQAAFNHGPQLALLMLWTGLEEIFSLSRSELRYRISSLIASYLEPPGQGRLARQKAIAKLYDSRSAAAHGRSCPRDYFEDAGREPRSQQDRT